jgi:hypothetical protein
LKAGLIGIETNPGREPQGPRRQPLHSRLLHCAHTLTLLALFGFAAHAWSQQAEPATQPVSAPSDTQSPAPPAQPVPQPTGSIHGVVVNREGAVYEGARISLALTEPTPGPGTQPPDTTVSDTNGHFNFPEVLPGAFKVTISADGFATQILAGVLDPGESYETPEIVLLVKTATSEVRVNASVVEVAQEQLRVEETQRVLGVIPNFYVSYAPHPAPLTPRQKFELAWKSSTDPFSFLATGLFAGIEQADNSISGYGQGVEGYAKRYGANYADNFISTMIGSALLQSILRQDPRYFYQGTGTIRSRAFHAIASTVMCMGDNGHWQPNYSGIVGNLAASGISNLYYPAANRDGAALTFENALVGTAFGAVQNLFQEFVVRKLTPKLPNYGPRQP